MSSESSSTSQCSRAWLILPVIGLGVVVAVISAFLATRPDAHTVSQVHREVRRILLHQSTQPDVEDGGAIGPWWVAASSVDEMTGEFRNFRLRSGPLRLAAETAILHVSPEANAISFELKDVVFTAVPDSAATDPSLVRLDEYILGPAPYQRPIVRDDSGHTGAPSARVVGVTD